MYSTLFVLWRLNLWDFLYFKCRRGEEREALDCFILDYIDYCTVMGWFRKKAGCKYDDDSPDGQAQWNKLSLCMSTLRATLPSKMKRLINPNNKTLGLSEEDKNNPVKGIQALVNRFSGSVSVQAEKTKMGQMFQNEGESISAWECRVLERARYCEYGDFEDQACRDRFIAGLVSEPSQGKLNSNGHRNKEGNIVEFRTVVQIAKNYESSTDAGRLWMSLYLMVCKKHIICLRRTPTQSEMCQCKKARSFLP